jgi:HlyD family secretion protein
MAFVEAKNSTTARIAIARAALIAAVGVAALSQTEVRAQSPSASAVVVKAVNGCFASAVRFTGLVVPRAEAIVNLDADGYQISEVLVAEGDIVTSGQVLVRMTRLASPAAPPPSAAPPMGFGPLGAPAMPQPPATKRLTAPAGGLVSKSTARVGAIAAPVPLPPPLGPEPLFRIIVDNKLEIEADVPSIDLPKLKAEQLARVQLENGRELTSQIRTILPEIDRRTQLGKVRLTIDTDPAIRAGMFASGTIDASHSCGVSIPRSAVEYLTEGPTVQIVRDATVMTRRLGLGLSSDTDVEVKYGIQEGDLVVANAGASLHDGDRVKPMFADELSQQESQ